MDDAIRNHQTPADEDPLIHRYLGGLPAFAPVSPHFDDRVLASVRRPAPEWAQRLTAKRHELFESGLHRKVVGLLALGGLVPTAAVVVLAAIFHAEIAWGVDWLFGTGLPFAWERVAAEASRAAANVESALRSVVPDAMLSVRGAAVLTAVLAGCTFGLIRTMKAKKAVTP
jgi:hypothetical protein